MAEPLRVEGLRELDAAVGEHVMHLEVAMTPLPSSRQKGDIWRDLPRYSESIAAAWEVVERMERGKYVWQFAVAGGRAAAQLFDNGKTVGAFHADGGSDGMPLAISVAALRAVGVEVELALPEAEDGSRLRAGKERRD